MRFGACTLILLTMQCAVVAQYRAVRKPSGMSLPGEAFIELTIPKYAVSHKPFTEVLKEIAKLYGTRFAVEIVVDDRFIDPLISLDITSTSFRVLFDRVLRQTGYDDAGWWVGKAANLVEISMGQSMRPDYPLAVFVDDWSTPLHMSPENVLTGLFWEVPELRSRFYQGGVIGSRPPYVAYGCETVFTADNMRVREVIERLAQMANKSWVLVYAQKQDKILRWIVF
jgi:hypothetical protein